MSIHLDDSPYTLSVSRYPGTRECRLKGCTGRVLLLVNSQAAQDRPAPVENRLSSPTRFSDLKLGVEANATMAGVVLTIRRDWTDNSSTVRRWIHSHDSPVAFAPARCRRTGGYLDDLSSERLLGLCRWFTFRPITGKRVVSYST